MHYLQPRSKILLRNALPIQSTCPSRIHTHSLPVPFRFFSLPPELRHMIMRYAVTKSEPLFIKPRPLDRHGKLPRKTRSGHLKEEWKMISPEKYKWGPSRMAILFTCRQAYAEGYKLYYAGNTFGSIPRFIKRFSEEIPAPRIQLIRSIVISLNLGHREAWPLLARLNGLETLHLILPKSIPPTPQTRQLEDFWKDVWKLPQLQKIRIEKQQPLDPPKFFEISVDRREGLHLGIEAAEEEIDYYLGREIRVR